MTEKPIGVIIAAYRIADAAGESGWVEFHLNYGTTTA
jgi:hypothetical protein